MGHCLSFGAFFHDHAQTMPILPFKLFKRQGIGLLPLIQLLCRFGQVGFVDDVVALENGIRNFVTVSADLHRYTLLHSGSDQVPHSRPNHVLRLYEPRGSEK